MNLTLEYESFQDFANKLWPCLSEKGMWVRSEDPAAVGELVDFDVTLADGFRLFHGTGQVIAVGPGPEGASAGEGMTLRFSQLDQPSRNLVRKVVSKHTGEGGSPFVLSNPGTKIEVVGDDDSANPSRDESGGMGSGDLVAPFAGLEDQEAWKGEAEPQLTSFLRTSGRDTELTETTDPASEVAEVEPPAVDEVQLPKVDEVEQPEEQAAAPFVSEEAADTTEEEAADSELEGFGMESVTPPVEQPLSFPPAVDEEAEATTDAGTDEETTEAAADEVEVTPWTPEPTETVRPLDPISAETQRIEPLEPEAAVGSGFGMSSFDEGGVEPLPSTVMPPTFPGAEGDEASPSEESFDLGEDFEMEEGRVERSRRSRWPWVVVVGLVVGAGLYALWQMETPLSGLFGNGDPEPAATASRAVRPPTGGEGGRSPSTGAQPGESPAEASETDVPSAAEGGLATTEPTPAPTDARDAAGGQQTSRPTPRETPREPVDPPARSVETTGAAASASAGERERPAPSATPAPEPLRLQRITWRDVEGDTVIRLALGGPATADRFETERVSTGSPRAVLKILGIRGSVPSGPVVIGSDEVQQLRFGTHNVDGLRQVHVVADLAAEGVEMVGDPVIADGAVEWRFANDR